MDKSHRNLFIVLGVLLLGAFAFNRWAFKKSEPLEARFFMAPLVGDAQLADQVFGVLDLDWRENYAPMLLEAYDFAATNRQERIIQLLQAKTGQNFGADTGKWWTWIWQQNFEPFAEYAEFKATVYEQLDPSFREYFNNQRPATIRLDEVMWGGMRRDEVPPLINPATVPVTRAGYLNDSDIVFGVAINGQFRAYPERITAQHEVVNDNVGGTSLCLVQSVLSGSSALFASSAMGTDQVFGNSGFFYRGHSLIYDHSSKSLWSGLTGEAVVGPLATGANTLARLPVVRTSWVIWHSLHPDTTVLSMPEGSPIDYTEGRGYRAYGMSDDIPFPVYNPSEQFKPKTVMFIVVLDGTPVVYPFEPLKPKSLFAQRRGIALLVDPSGGIRAYGTGGVQMETIKGVEMVDTEGNSWELGEEALTREDQKLPRLPAFDCFWFAFHALYPDAEVVDVPTE